LVFGPVFFSNLEPWAATIASFGTFATGYLARPVGGIVFGHFGDRISRKKMLVISMLLMGISSTSIGLISPTSVIGSWGAVLLVALRLCQGIAVGGEWGGAALMALEHSDQKRRGFSASFSQAGAPMGTCLASLMLGLFATLPEDQFLEWGWRIPFLISAVLLAVGMWTRLKVSESPLFVAARTNPEAVVGTSESAPLWSVLRNPRGLILSVFSTTGNFVLATTMTVFGVADAVQNGSSQQTVLFAVAIASVFQVPLTVFMGYLADLIGRRATMISGLGLFTLALYQLLQWLASNDAVLIFLALMIGKTLQSMVYGPMAAFIGEQFATESRYTGASLGYQTASMLGSGFTPLMLSWADASSEQNTMSIVVAVGAVSAIGMISLAVAGDTKDRDLSRIHAQPGGVSE
jgi:MFS family permease